MVQYDGMKHTDVIDAALQIVNAGRTAHIYYDGSLQCGEEPAGKTILVLRPTRRVSRQTLLVMLTHRMRMKGISNGKPCA